MTIGPNEFVKKCEAAGIAPLAVMDDPGYAAFTPYVVKNDHWFGMTRATSGMVKVGYVPVYTNLGGDSIRDGSIGQQQMGTPTHALYPATAAELLA